MKKKEIAISVENVSLAYHSFSKFSIQKNLLALKKLKRKTYVALENISFTVEKGKILGIIGKNGCGKSTLLKVIGNVFAPDSGSINTYNHTVSLMALGVGFNGSLSGYENIFLTGMLLGFSKEQIQEKLEDIINFSELEDFIYESVKTYSSGMLSKLAFSITAILETDILLIDEVLSVGDINFKQKSFAKIQSLINDKQKTVLIVSHDMNTLEKICDEVLWLHEGKIKMIGNPSKVILEYKKFMKVK